MSLKLTNQVPFLKSFKTADKINKLLNNFLGSLCRKNFENQNVLQRRKPREVKFFIFFSVFYSPGADTPCFSLSLFIFFLDTGFFFLGGRFFCAYK